MKNISTIIFILCLIFTSYGCNFDFLPKGDGFGGVDNGLNNNDDDTDTFSVLRYRNNASEIGFYDWTKENTLRPVRNDLTGGALTGMVQFGQSHTVEAKGNKDKFLPSLVSERGALLLFTPSESIAKSIKVLNVKVSDERGVVGELKLRHPNFLPMSDTSRVSKQPVAYSRKAWSAELPWDWVKPGMELEFRDESGKVGVLPASEIEFGGASEGVFVFIRLGMLTNFRTTGNGYMFTDPARAMADYFQTANFAKITNVTYEPRSLMRVIVANGTIYDVNSPDPELRQSKTDGGIYSGDMRENVGKSQVSVGINMANFGIPTNSMTQKYSHQYYQMTVHLNQGLYKNGVVSHGLSGGNGIGTLVDTTGNEFSHEVGHALGLGGHYIKPKDTPDWWQQNHADSGWGYSGYKKRMRSALNWGSKGDNPDNNFKGLYNYHKDTMSGGSSDSAISRYTQLTGYTSMLTQNFLENKPVMNESSSTGYLKWNKDTRKMEEFKWADQNGYKVLKPYKMGVPVITLLGGYDPLNFATTPTAVVYPYFRGNWGNVYNLAAPDKTKDASCWLEIGFLNGLTQEIGLSAVRHATGTVNQFHVNIEEERKPNSAKLYCQKSGDTPVLLDSQIIPTDLEPMEKASIIGKEYGYQHAYLADIKELEPMLYSQKDAVIPVLQPKETEQLINIFEAEMSSFFTPQSFNVAEKFLKTLYGAKLVTRFIDKNLDSINRGDDATIKQLKKMLDKSGLFVKGLSSFNTDVFKIGNSCVTMYEKDDKTLSLKMQTCVDGDTNQQWLYDLGGKIRPLNNPVVCLEAPSSNSKVLSVQECSEENNSHRWSLYGKDSGAFGVRSVANTNRCIDRDTHGYPVMWSCNDGGNQLWVNLPKKDDNPALLQVYINKPHFRLIYEKLY